jgi:hypothetical protein
MKWKLNPSEMGIQKVFSLQQYQKYNQLNKGKILQQLIKSPHRYLQCNLYLTWVLQ